jgi:hypothetical protein
LALPEGQENQIVHDRLTRAAQSTFRCKGDLLDEIEPVCRKVLTSGWLSRFLIQHWNALTRTIVCPQELCWPEMSHTSLRVDLAFIILTYFDQWLDANEFRPMFNLAWDLLGACSVQSQRKLTQDSRKFRQ